MTRFLERLTKEGVNFHGIGERILMIHFGELSPAFGELLKLMLVCGVFRLGSLVGFFCEQALMMVD